MKNKMDKWLYDHPKAFGFICVASFLTGFTMMADAMHWYHSKK